MSTYTYTRLKKLCRHNTYTRLRKLCQHNRICVFILVFLFLFCLLWLSGYSIDEVKASRCVWGSQLHTYPQSVLYLACHRRIFTNCTVLKKDDPCCGNSLWNGLPMGFVFLFCIKLHQIIYTSIRVTILLSVYE